jgi:hypothetical protein
LAQQRGYISGLDLIFEEADEQYFRGIGADWLELLSVGGKVETIRRLLHTVF